MVKVTVVAVFLSVELSLRASPPSAPVNKADTLALPSGSHRPDSSLALCTHKGGNSVCLLDRKNDYHMHA